MDIDGVYQKGVDRANLPHFPPIIRLIKRVLIG